ncbi:MAG TPA: phenylalanine--tRNA ligase subunit beta [Candidatus Acidoferrum sp.]|nr:phenylalanine--tRNA ligase subunit beta [Candidatus Acidoferrum sp.]
MKILYDWVKEFVDAKAPASEVRSRLSLSGTAVDAVEETAAGPMFDAELTINRPDCMGHYGVAREVATIYRLPLNSVAPKIKESAEAVSAAARVEIATPELCGRYTARVIRGVKVAPSPDWLKKRLEALGHGSINNVVDATNYAMLELGHPMHAFDYDKLAEHRIVVRRAKAGEKMRTLDGIERALGAEMCVIADASRAVAIGGVMGGQDSEIGFASRNILLESAWFDPISIRKTAKALGMRTEASTRFERGMDPELAELASRRCTELIQQVAGGEALAGVVDVYPRKPQPGVLLLARRELLRVMGGDVPDAEIETILTSLGFDPRRTDKDGGANSPAAVWECRQPSWRADAAREIDLIEEVVRHYGLDKFAPRLPAARTTAARLPNAAHEDRLRERLAGLGYQEILTIPIVDPAVDAMFRAESDVAVHIANPLAEDASAMRSSGIGNMLAAIEWNLNRGQRSVRLFEIARAYRWNGKEPEERAILTIGATGFAREKSVAETAREFSFADLKGDLDRLGELAGGLQWTAEGPAWLHAARRGSLSFGKTASQDFAGAAGQLARGAAEKLKLRQDIFLAEFMLAPFYTACAAAQAARRYMPISKFPAVERDFSLMLGDGTTFANVLAEIRALRIPEIIEIEAVDLFRGGQVPAGKFSLLVHVTFQSPTATLTESQLSDFSNRIAAALIEKLGAALRTA